ncbi:MAG TPA: hypothetical protein V6D20_18315, partial [Candidatus Obscuribacterales bacterium]
MKHNNRFFFSILQYNTMGKKKDQIKALRDAKKEERLQIAWAADQIRKPKARPVGITHALLGREIGRGYNPPGYRNVKKMVVGGADPTKSHTREKTSTAIEKFPQRAQQSRQERQAQIKQEEEDLPQSKWEERRLQRKRELFPEREIARNIRTKHKDFYKASRY